MVIGNQPHKRGVVRIFNDCVSVVVWYTVMCVQREEEGGCISDLKYDRGHKGGSFCSEQCLGGYYNAKRFHINTKTCLPVVVMLWPILTTVTLQEFNLTAQTCSLRNKQAADSLCKNVR